MTATRGQAWALALAVACGVSVPRGALAQDFSVPKMVDEDETGTTPRKKKGKGSKVQDEDDPRGAQDDGETVEFGGKRKKGKAVGELVEDGPAAPGPSKPDPGPPQNPLVGPPLPPPTSATPPAPVKPVTPDAGPSVSSVPPAAPTPVMPGASGAALTHLNRAKQSISVTKVDYGALFLAWDEHRKLAETSPAAAQKQLLTVVNTLKAMGGGAPGGAQAPDMALALVEEAHGWLDKLEADRALALADTAVMLAPSVPATHLAVARARYIKNPGDVAPIASAVGNALTADLSDLPLLLRWLLAAAMALGGTVLWLLLAVVVLAGARRLPLLAHDVGHVFPRHMRGGVSGALAAVLLSIPLLLRLGPLPTVLWWLLLAWRYLERGERVMAGGAALLTAGLPLLMQTAAPMLLFPRTNAYAMYVGQMDVAQAAVLRPRVDKAPMDPLSLGVSGLMHKRAGDLEAARAALEHSLRLEPANAWVHINLGCVYASLGELDRAQQQFERASELDPTDALALHNSATLHNLLGRTGAARDAFEAADHANRAKAMGYRDRATATLPRPHNVAFLDAPAPLAAFVPAALARTPESEEVAMDLWGRICPSVPAPLYPFMVLGLMVAFALVEALGRRVSTARACARCGSPACRSCDGPNVDRQHCAQCYNAFLVRGARVEAALKIRKDVEIRRYRGRRRVLARLLSVAWAGAGQLYAGLTVPGAVLMVAFTLAGTLGLLTAWLLPDPYGLQGSGAGLLRGALPALPVVVAWLLGLVLMFRTEDT